MKLRRFWFEFAQGANLPPGVKLGCGVTAFDLADAQELLRDRVFRDELPPVTSVIEDVDVSALDPGDVLPNMRPPSNRGVWFPLGYSH